MGHSISKKIKTRFFNPDGVGNTSNNIFGLPYTVDESEIVIIPVPWDVTVSGGEGTSEGPLNVFNESFQIDLFDESIANPWIAGIAMEQFPADLLKKNNKLRKKSREYIKYLEQHGEGNLPAKLKKIRDRVNAANRELLESVTEKCRQYLGRNKLAVILGGDHSTPLGLIKALSEINSNMGILQLDAHADLRPNYEGFEHSHASIMHNALTFSQISKLIQVGIRDFSSQEWTIIKESPGRIRTFTDRELQMKISEGVSWSSICNEIIDELPPKVYISFDVDSLEPSYCPSTGTPVPGGLGYNQAIYLIEKLANSGRTILGFDIVEIGPSKLDGIVSCRLLYKIIALMLLSNKKIK